MGVAAEQGGAKAPTSAADEAAGIFHDEVGPVLEQLRVDAERAAQRALHLLGTVVLPAQAARRAGDQQCQCRDVFHHRVTQQ